MLSMMVSANSTKVFPGYLGLGGVGLPAIVVVAVDVQDLLALDTEHTMLRGVSSVCGSRGRSSQLWTPVGLIYPERMHSVRPVAESPMSASWSQQQPETPGVGGLQ